MRTISFSHDGALLASASEDMRIDIGHVETTQKVAEIAVDSPTFTISWHPSRYIHTFCHCVYIISSAHPIAISITISKQYMQLSRYLLAYACDDKDKYDRERDQGSLKVWGFPSE